MLQCRWFDECHLAVSSIISSLYTISQFFGLNSAEITLHNHGFHINIDAYSSTGLMILVQLQRANNFTFTSQVKHHLIKNNRWDALDVMFLM